jgi:hypothetical protein
MALDHIKNQIKVASTMIAKVIDHMIRIVHLEKIIEGTITEIVEKATMIDQSRIITKGIKIQILISGCIINMILSFTLM